MLWKNSGDIFAHLFQALVNRTRGEIDGEVYTPDIRPIEWDGDPSIVRQVAPPPRTDPLAPRVKSGVSVRGPKD